MNEIWKKFMLPTGQVTFNKRFPECKSTCLNLVYNGCYNNLICVVEFRYRCKLTGCTARQVQSNVKLPG